MTRQKQTAMLRDYLVEIRKDKRLGNVDSDKLKAKAQAYIKAYMDLEIIDCVEACETYKDYIDW